MSIARKPTQVRLAEGMVEDFKRNVQISQTLQPK
jgi:hypothetical protein